MKGRGMCCFEREKRFWSEGELPPRYACEVMTIVFTERRHYLHAQHVDSGHNGNVGWSKRHVSVFFVQFFISFIVPQ
jgi:hypothetical protein